MVLTLDMLPAEIFIHLLVFARLGAALMLLPVFGEPGVNPRMRLAIALGLTLVAVPVLRPLLPPMPDAYMSAALLIIREAVIGLALGALIRILVSALHMAGTIIATQTGLAFAMAFDPAQGSQSALFASFLTLLATTLILMADLHHGLLAATVDSYRIFPSSGPLPVEDLANLSLRWFADAFVIALQLSAPFLVFGFVFYAAMGVLSKLMPQLQIIFIAMPVNITMGYLIMALILAAFMAFYLTAFEARIDLLLGR